MTAIKAIKSPQRAVDIPTYTAIITGLINAHELKKAKEVFQMLINDGLKPSQVICTLLFNEALKGACYGDALDVLTMMRSANTKPDATMYMGLLNSIRHKPQHNELTNKLMALMDIDNVSYKR